MLAEGDSTAVNDKENQKSEQASGEGATENAGEAAGDENLDFGKKKKKGGAAKVKFDEEQNEVIEFHDPNQDPNKKKEDQKLLIESDGHSVWQGTERDYTYDELLTRVFNIMKEKNPDMITGEKRKFVMKPPQVNRVGTKKTSFSNFADICKL